MTPAKQLPNVDCMLNRVDEAFDKTLAVLDTVETPTEMLAWWHAFELAIQYQTEALGVSGKVRIRT